MTSLNRPILFLATKDAGRGRRFYQDTLRLAFVADEPAALVFHVGGTMLRIQKVERLPELQHTVLGWSVDDIQQSMASLGKNGVRFNRYEELPQDEQGVWESPSGAKVAWFTDPDGNTLSLTQH